MDDLVEVLDFAVERGYALVLKEVLELGAFHLLDDGSRLVETGFSLGGVLSHLGLLQVNFGQLVVDGFDLLAEKSTDVFAVAVEELTADGVEGDCGLLVGCLRLWELAELGEDTTQLPLPAVGQLRIAALFLREEQRTAS